MSGNVAPQFCYCWTHFWSTFWSSNYAYDISFQSLGSHESRTSNGMRFGGEMKKLWWFEDKRAKLSENFAAETPFGRVFRSCETTFWHTSAICSTIPLISKLRYTCEITFELWNGCEMISKLQNGCGNAPSFKNGLRKCHFAVKWSPSFKIVAKSPPSLEMAFKLRNWLVKWRVIYKNTLQSQGKLLKCQQSPTIMHLKRRALHTLGSHTPNLSLHFWPP